MRCVKYMCVCLNTLTHILIHTLALLLLCLLLLLLLLLCLLLLLLLLFQLFFTRNGEYLGVACRGVSVAQELFPLVGLHSKHSVSNRYSK